MATQKEEQTAEKTKSNLARREEEILAFWRENSVFEKSLEQTKDGEEFVFYDGPPFATGLPHYGHILAGTIKDVIPRYQTMRGKHVPRRWGWDCHGLPAENEIEKELNLNTRKEIEEYGIDKFNEAAREAVQRYADEWRRIIPRLGRWVDMDSDYRTMDPDYTESVWWSFKKLYDDGLIYKGFKSMHICPRCETTLSNFEVTQGYQEVKDLSVTAKFKVQKSNIKIAEEKPLYLLAWTTTPWTLPGNVALAVNNSISYLVSRISETGEHVVVAKECAETVLAGTEHEIVTEISGDELVGAEYEPLFNYYKGADLEHKENAWQVCAADFVTTEEGTGIVHIAPAFGADDLALAQDKSLPMIQHVGKDGSFKEEVKDFSGLQAKPKDDPMATDIEIVKWLAHNEKLFAKEKITHSYPHCWRCDTPLLNYAAESWFVSVTGFRDALVAENKSINWVPPSIGANRFGDWLEEARDWAISRTRYWGAPLPVWVSEDGEEMEVVSDRDELHTKVPEKVAKVFFIRHAESVKNVKGIFDNTRDTYPLTENGEKRAKKAAEELKSESIDLIVTSPVRRARETAGIIAEELGCEVIEHEGLDEIDSGEWEGKSPEDPSIKDETEAYHNLPDEEYYRTPRGKTGETWEQIERRVYKGIFEILSENPGKTVLFATHQGTMVYALKALNDWSIGHTRENRLYDTDLVAHAKPHRVYIDVERQKTFDFHRPYIDAITYENENGKTMERIEDVFDCWYESGSMPYASQNFTGGQDRPQYFPANFIAEGIDQTRGWFYSMLVLSTALFGESAYRNVVVNGTILAEDGSKMSKRKKNYPDPMRMVDEYGADALRYYLMASPAVRAEPLNFSEDGVKEVRNKVITRLLNVVSFYEQYQNESPKTQASNSKHVLDRWVIARLNQVNEQMTNSLEKYELDRAARPIGEFVDDLSTWYLRRSRERIKGGNGEEDKQAALGTLQYALEEFAKLIAPITPFLAEDVYGQINGKSESVHLESWPEGGEVSEGLLTDMDKAREVVTQALEQRAQSGIKVRQPLAKLTITEKLDEEHKAIIADEVNVKEVEEGDELTLDTELTDELKREGAIRELTRAIQDLRKDAGLNPGDEARLSISTDEAGQKLVEEWKDDITKTAALSGISFDSVEEGKGISANGYSFTVGLSQ